MRPYGTLCPFKIYPMTDVPTAREEVVPLPLEAGTVDDDAMEGNDDAPRAALPATKAHPPTRHDWGFHPIAAASATY